MTVEEAINYVVQERDTYIEVCEEWEALDMAIEALEKQIPKKPKKGLYNVLLEFDWIRDCPECGCGLVDTEKYCSQCGQALDRSEE